MLVGRTGMTLNAPAPVAVHAVPAALPLHVWAESTMEMVKGPAAKRS